MAKPIQKTRTTTYTNVFVGIASIFGSFSILFGVGAGLYGQEFNNFALARNANVKIVEGTYDVGNGDTVHYRACIPEDMQEGDQYPALLFAPGLDINHDRWTYWCITMADNDYITLMKDRPGDTPLENRQEIEAGLAFMRNAPEIDAERIVLGGSSYGHREVMNYILEYPDDIPGYFNISGYNDPGKMRTAGSFENHNAKVLVMSGGGEVLDRDCDTDGFAWTGAFTQKLLDEKEESLEYRAVFDAETYGCTPHGYMFDPRRLASQESASLMSDFIAGLIGKGPTPLEE